MRGTPSMRHLAQSKNKSALLFIPPNPSSSNPKYLLFYACLTRFVGDLGVLADPKSTLGVPP